jgi:hypothetical protein
MRYEANGYPDSCDTEHMTTLVAALLLVLVLLVLVLLVLALSNRVFIVRRTGISSQALTTAQSGPAAAEYSRLSPLDPRD